MQAPTKERTKEQGRAHSIHEITRVAAGAGDAVCFDEPLHQNPFVSGILAKIALFPPDVAAAVAAVLRFALRDDELGRAVREAVEQLEQGLPERDADVYGREGFFWSGLLNGVEIEAYAAKQQTG